MSHDLFSALNWRAAIKHYDPKKTLTSEQVVLLTESARMAPSSYGVQPVKLYVVSNKEKKKQLKAAAYNQPQFEGASHIFIFAAKKVLTKKDIQDFIQRISDQRQTPVEELETLKSSLEKSLLSKSEKKMHTWSAFQAYIALGMALMTAAIHKIDTSPMGGFNADKFDEILKLPNDWTSVVIMAAGFRSVDDTYSKKPKVRKTTTDFVTVID